MLGSLEEFRYLTVPNAPLYRAAMQFFFEQYLNQRSALPPEDVQELLKSQAPDFSFDDTLFLLDQLVEWGNLGRRRDPRRVATLREYARRRDLYHATPRGLAIEQFIASGLDGEGDSVTVSAGVVASLEERLGQLQSLLQVAQPQAETIEALWVEIYRNFTDLSGDLRSLGVNLERRLSLDALAEFLDYKDVVRSYIERLARELAGAGRRVRQQLASWSEAQRTTLSTLVARVQAGRLTVSAGVVDEGKTRVRVNSEFVAMQGWFGRGIGEGDGLEFAIEGLRTAMRRVLEYVDAVHRTRELGLGRAGELEQLAHSLSAESDAHWSKEQLSQYLGLFAALHPTYDQDGEPMESSWPQPITTVTLYAVQKGRIALPPSAAVGRTSPEAQAAAREATKAFRAKERALLDLFKHEGGILKLDGLVLPSVELLRDLLRYLEPVFRQPQSVTTVMGPEGRLIEVELEDEPALVQGSDWSLWLERGAVLRLVQTLEVENA